MSKRGGLRWPYQAAAAVVTAVLGFVFNQPDPVAPSVVATVARSLGETFWYADEREGRFRPGGEVRAGDVIATGTDGRLRIVMASGLDVRLDVATRVDVVTGDQLRLISGQLYVDSLNGNVG